jgi:cytochrome P450
VLTLTSYADAREAFRHKSLKQALYDEGHRLMDGVIVNLHGSEHLDRRRLENRLFRRDVFAWYETERIPAIIDVFLERAVSAGSVDLLPLARRTMMTLSIEVAGVDLPDAAESEIDGLYALMDRLARASTVAHAVGDKEAIIADGDQALREFDERFFRRSRDRRRELVDDVESGRRDEADLPRDVLTTLLRNQERLDLPSDVVLREVAYFPWVGSHSTSNQFVHAIHHVFEWLDHTPGDRDRLVGDQILLQRFVHESLRLHPASPVSLRHALDDVTLRSGTRLPEGSMVVIDVESANRDPLVWGPAAADFDPFRTLADGVVPWGLSFGHGVHACLGQELAGGLECPVDHVGSASSGDSTDNLVGSITVMIRAALAAGARRDPADPPRIDSSTTRRVWSRYLVVFDAV